jgi:ribosomal protein S18 acetylase RimI-like enzyme
MLTSDPTSFNVSPRVTRSHDPAWWEQWALDAVAATDKIVFFAEVNASAVGMIAAHVDDGVVHTGALWIEPDHRHAGLAGALLNAVETWARDVRATTVELSVAEHNDGARRLYERRHYRATGERVPTRFSHHEIVMNKPVGT